MKLYFSTVFVCLLALLISGCKDMYDLPGDVKNVKLLVVEGNLNSGSGATTIQLSRTISLKDTTSIKPELKATVTVEGENGSNYTLTGNTKGEYSSPQLPLNAAIKYRLRIKTSDTKEYLSDFVRVLIAPPIDSISWKRRESGIETGIQIYITTHDLQNNTRYYRWEYDETWEFHSRYYSAYEYRNDSVLILPDPDKQFKCWKSQSSNRVLISSSARLAQDEISLYPLNIIPFNTIQLTVRYSIHVKQFALTKEGYDYWDILKKNTENVGSLFDPQPSILVSNIHCLTDPNEQVVGYISAGATTEKRIFITKNQIEPWNYDPGCIEEIVVLKKDYKQYFGTKRLIPTTEAHDMYGNLIGYFGGEPICVDCTLKGSNVKPSFW